MGLVGWTEHERAVERLRASYAAIPAGAPVRLAKRTSNLFRARSAVSVPGLDVSGLGGVIALDPAARTADVLSVDPSSTTMISMFGKLWPRTLSIAAPRHVARL